MKVFVNILTTARLLYSFILPLIWLYVPAYVLILSMVIIFLTDFIDGFLARKYKVQTLYGKLMDVGADKALSVILMILLLGKIKIFVYVLILEVIIALITIYGSFVGRHIFSSKIGKKKMWILSITIILGYMYYYGIVNYNIIILTSYLTIIFQIWTMVDYMISIVKNKNEKVERYKIKSWTDIKYVLFNTEYYNTCIRR